MENEKAVREAEDCRILLNALLGNAEYHFGEKLRFDDVAIDVVLRATFPQEYKETFKRLKAEKDKLLEEVEARDALYGTVADAKSVEVTI